MSIVNLLQEELRLGHIIEDDWAFEQFHEHEPFLFCLHEADSSPCQSPAPSNAESETKTLEEPEIQPVACDISKATLSCCLSRGDKWSTKVPDRSSNDSNSEVTALAIAIRDGQVITE